MPSTSGAFLPEAVAALKGARQSAVIRTHEHIGDIDERLDFPGSWQVQVQHMAGHKVRKLAGEEIRRSLRQPVGSVSLREMAEGKKTAVITFDDLTRPTPSHEAIPLVIEELKAAGLRDENILLLTSFGAHRPIEQDEVAIKIGKETARRFPWINHNTFRNVVDVGETSYKNRIKINRTFVGADLRIVVTGVKVHTIAGYGGGAKAVLPGVAGIESIEYNHRVIASKNPTVGEVKIFKNDVRKDMEEAAHLAKVDFALQLVINGQREVCAAFAGDIVESHRAACRMANRHYRPPTVNNADIVVANGYPQNAQATKGLAWIRRSVRDGGTGVLIIQHPQCMSGWHYVYEPGYASGRHYWDAFPAKASKTQSHQLIVYSQYLQKRQMDMFAEGTSFATSWSEVIKLLTERHKKDSRVAVYPYSCIQQEEVDLDEA